MLLVTHGGMVEGEVPNKDLNGGRSYYELNDCEGK